MRLTAVPPGQLRHTGQRGDQIIQRPGNDDAVVDVEPEHDGHCGVSNTLKTVDISHFKSPLCITCIHT